MNIFYGYGDSMLPTMHKFGIARFKKLKTYNVGDIVYFKGNNGNKYSHRIISIDDKKLTTQGDNRITSESYEIDVPVENILGKVVWWFP